MALDVDASDVVRIVLQFCKENNLTQTYAALADETQCALNTVDSVEGFVGDIRNGRWDLVLPQVATMRLPKRKLEDLYEQVAVETMESNEVDAARALLRESVTMTTMRAEQPELVAEEAELGERRELIEEGTDGRGPVGGQDLLGRRMRTKRSPLKPSDNEVFLELLRRMKSTTADQMGNLHAEGRQHRLSGCGAPWNTLRHHQGALQPPPQQLSLSPQMLHPRQWHRRTTGQAGRGALVQGLKVQVRKIGFLGQAEGRHLRRQLQASRRDITKQGGGDPSGQRR